MAWWNAPLISPAVGFYALLAIGVVWSLGWIVARMLSDRRIGPDPIESQFEAEPRRRSRGTSTGRS